MADFRVQVADHGHFRLMPSNRYEFHASDLHVQSNCLWNRRRDWNRIPCKVSVSLVELSEEEHETVILVETVNCVSIKSVRRLSSAKEQVSASLLSSLWAERESVQLVLDEQCFRSVPRGGKLTLESGPPDQTSARPADSGHGRSCSTGKSF